MPRLGVMWEAWVKWQDPAGCSFFRFRSAFITSRLVELESPTLRCLPQLVAWHQFEVDESAFRRG